jgi:hypothetical protein
MVLDENGSQLKRLYSGVTDTSLGQVIIWISELARDLRLPQSR